MNLFGVLNVGATGMRTHQFGLSVAGQNATSATTEGYSRKQINVESLPYPLVGGARAVGSRRVTDQLVERRLTGARSQAAYEDARLELGQTVDELFVDFEGGLATRMDAFQQSLSDFATYPDDPAARAVVLQAATDLSRSFNFAAETLNEVQAEANSKVEDGVAEVNDRLHEIADLGRQISRLENPLGAEASDLRDRRDQLIREVSDFVPVKTIEQDDGSISVLLNGSLSMVNPDGSVTELQAATDATTGDVTVERVSAGVLEDVTNLLSGGRLGGLMQARDGLVDATEAQLDQLAFDLSAAYNTVHQAGFGLDGNTGRNLFEPIGAVAGAARALSLSADVAGSPNLLAAASDPTSLPGDDRGALNLVGVADADVTSGASRTIGEAFGDMLGSVGAEVRSMRSEADYTESVAEQVEAVRQGVSGVSTDEEMIALSQFQRAYEASIQVVRTADELLAEVISLKR